MGSVEKFAIPVIARSASDEAIQKPVQNEAKICASAANIVLVCFATLAMTGVRDFFSNLLIRFNQGQGRSIVPRQRDQWLS